jgi:hypothetical protein
LKEEENLKRRQKIEEQKGDGKIILSQMKMMKKIEYQDGFLPVFPNRKHQNRKDGFGCSSLSPMKLGPVNHKQPGLPPAQNIENLFQGSKVYPQEMEGDEPSPLFYENRLKFYEDEEPHRHKFPGNIPSFFLWVSPTGEELRLTYIESRQVYCQFYEKLASEKEDFRKLVQMKEEGMNLMICGYDARPLQVEDVEKEYLDPNQPFGHEKVLFCMLIGVQPWKKFTFLDL